MPKWKKACSYPDELIILEIGRTVSAAPAPKPAAVTPAASPRRPGNHFSALPTQVPYTEPVPMPPIAAPTYSIESEFATEFKTQASALSTAQPGPPTRGPYRSTRSPTTATSHVSTRTKIVNATWIADRPQWYL